MSKIPIEEVETPLMKQYNSIKAKYPDAILLFRVGDFYETFGEDAVKTSACLGIVLTKRANGKAHDLELAGFPYHSLESYLPKLVRAGHRVAICDQLEDPKLTKKIVKRGVTEMVTPGVALNDTILNNKSNNFLASLFWEGAFYGLALLDVSTGEFYIAEGNKNYIEKLMQSFLPSEVLYPKSRGKDLQQEFYDKYYTFKLDDWVYQYENCLQHLLQTFQTQSLKGFGIEEERLSIIAAGAIIQYLKDTEHHHFKHINKIQKLAAESFVWLDRFTIRNLELVWSQHPGATTLIDILDETQSPMGARLLRKWVVMPLIEPEAINDRLNIVEGIVKEEELLKFFQQQLKSIGDLERLISKVSLEKVNPRELVQLKRSLLVIPVLKENLNTFSVEALKLIGNKLKIQEELTSKISKFLKEDSGPVIAKGNFINDGVQEELDELRTIRNSSKDILAKIQQDEMIKTGISSLKIGFNNVFGYFLEVTHAHKNKVPNEWIRKQTLTSAERYITPELKVLEEKILGAEEKIQRIEEAILTELIQFVKDFIVVIQQNANIIAQLDCLLSFASVSLNRNYVKPIINSTYEIDIKNGRHPVIETHLPVDQPFVPNDVFLDNSTQQILMITGPNMSGKSALLRQTALIVLMAQMGCFVPASYASIGLVDRIFTRVGASDNISGGESTFMVEMNETASIVNNLSPRSLVLLDEIGRGTSTYDGISIAWSLAEYLHQNPLSKARTLFATHYHELNELEDKFDRIKNYHVTTKEVQNKIIFLRKLMRGGSEHSFGIHVAKLAGMPNSIVNRANEILRELESQRNHLQDTNNIKQTLKSIPASSMQLSFFDSPDPKSKAVMQQIEQLDINRFTPVEALMKLHELKKMLE